MKVQKLEKVQIDIGINNEREIRVNWLSTSLTATDHLTLAKEKNYIDFIVPVIQLVPGNYTLTLYATANGELLDWITDAFSFVIEQSDFFNTGKLPPAMQGFFCSHHTFKY